MRLSKWLIVIGGRGGSYNEASDQLDDLMQSSR